MIAASCDIFMEMICRISKKKICIMVTHDGEMVRNCGRVYELKDRRLAARDDGAGEWSQL